jgi:ribosomal protein L11 methyltransferase
VLSLVAVRSGARSVLSVDIDEVAVENARQNCVLNGASDKVHVELGSADATSAVFDLVIANINTPILVALAAELCARVSDNGKLLLTGLLIEDVPEIEAVFQSQQLRVTERRHADGWALLILRR